MHVPLFADTHSIDEPVKSLPYKTVFSNSKLMMAAVACAFANVALTAADPLLEPELRNFVSKRRDQNYCHISV